MRTQNCEFFSFFLILAAIRGKDADDDDSLSLSLSLLSATTTSNDALRKHGILPPKEAPPPSPSPPPSPTLSDFLNDLSPSEMRELADEAKDDATERAILGHRQRMLGEERRELRKARFGRVYPIARDDYTREVTEASKVNEEDDEEEQGTAVVCFLYKDGSVESNVYHHYLFISIIGFQHHTKRRRYNPHSNAGRKISKNKVRIHCWR